MVLEEATLQNVLQNAENEAELGIPVVMLNDLLLRLLYNEAHVSLSRATEVIRVHARLLDKLLEQMQFEHIVEVVSAGQIGRMSYVYQLSDAGRQRAREAFERSHYVGPAPVSLERYDLAIRLQTEDRTSIDPEAVRAALADLVLPEDFHRRIGLAMNAGHSLFLYGPPGNGKSTTADLIGGLLARSPIWLPYAVTVAGQIITIYDPLVHTPLPIPKETTKMLSVDKRWGLFRRPSVTVGGELTLESLELRFDPVTKFYEAPLQMKANGGMFLVDDFGRQQISPAALLNRWIVPLEARVDYLRLRTGHTMQVPFRQFLVFSTNLDPKDLVDEAFLRRIQVKVAMGRPDERAYLKIFQRMCQEYEIDFDKDAFVHLVQRWYRSGKQTMQAVHPRDLLNLVVATCDYLNEPRHLSADLIDEACDNYFVKDAATL